jgi:hypothetical protein
MMMLRNGTSSSAKNRKITILNRQKILPGNLTNTNIGVFIFLFVVGVLLYFFIFHIYF